MRKKSKYLAIHTLAGSLVAALAVLATAPATQAQTIYPTDIAPPAYFVPTGSYFNPDDALPHTVPAVIDSHYYNPSVPLFRSQRGRDNADTGPTRGDYPEYTPDRQPTDHVLYKERIRDMFRRVLLENEIYAYDNDTIPDATLDLRSLTTHTCFDPSGAEIRSCGERFGPFANIRSSLVNGTLFTVLTDDDTDMSDNIGILYERMIEQITSEDEDEPITTTSQMLRESRKLRSQLLWEICNAMYLGYNEAAVCYQRNARLVLDRELDVDIDAQTVE